MESIKIEEKVFNKPPKNGEFYIIGIDGRGGAGKSTLSEYILKLLPDFSIIHGDDYFEPDDNTIAFGAFNEDRFYNEVIMPIKDKKTSFSYRPYRWHSKPNIQEETQQINTGLIIERSFSFSFDLNYDLKIWVETPAQLALQRGQERDEMPLEQGYRSWKEVWQPQENRHIEVIKPLETADIIIDGTSAFEDQIS
jgi:uridine kinase